ncbi:MAG: hypothetical protein LIP08_14465 [Bacteroides sp.]|nr:hypothetical protein [Bacteroides sp.]
MKLKNYLLLLLFISLLSSCFTLPSPYYKSYIGDYSAFTRKGIFVTESDYIKFDYIAIGSVMAEVGGGWTKNTVQEYVAPDLDTLFEKLANKLISQHANGIINLNIKLIPKDKNKVSSYDRYIVTGMAVHIKEDISHILK